MPLTLSYQRGIDTQVSSQNLTLDIDNYRERVLKPQIVRLNNLIDRDVCNLAQGLNNWVGTPRHAHHAHQLWPREGQAR